MEGLRAESLSHLCLLLSQIYYFIPCNGVVSHYPIIIFKIGVDKVY